MRCIVALVFAALICACASTGAELGPVAPRTAWVVGTEGRAVGQATFIEGPAGVLIRLEFSEHGLPSGWHGLHLHQRGDCSDFAAGFQASGGHLGMDGRIQHGLMNAGGPEVGDLPNLLATERGAFGAEFLSPRVTLRGQAVRERAPLLDADGTALIIHAGTDDHVSQPIGGAGARIACAALTPAP
jgi:Cu-Zn family superoxide dismutase